MWIFHKSLTWQNTHQRKVCASLCLFFLSLSLSFLYISILSILTGGKRVLYNLYGVSNHSGGVHSGHYTANCKHPYSGEWNVFNDTRYAAIFFILYICYHSWNSKATIKIERWYFFLSLLKPKNPWIKFLFYLNLLLYVIFIVK